MRQPEPMIDLTELDRIVSQTITAIEKFAAAMQPVIHQVYSNLEMFTQSLYENRESMPVDNPLRIAVEEWHKNQESHE